MLKINIKLPDDQREHLGEVLDMMYRQLVGIEAYINSNIALIDDPKNNEIALTINKGESLDRVELNTVLSDMDFHISKD